MKFTELQANARKASTLLKAMCNERRLLILCHLAEGEKSVGQLEGLVRLSQSALSQHLARLRRDRLVKTRRSAQTIYYSLAGNEAQAVMATLHRLYCAGEARTRPPPPRVPRPPRTRRARRTDRLLSAGIGLTWSRNGRMLSGHCGCTVIECNPGGDLKDGRGHGRIS